jgi:hypothetical protein
MLCHRATRLNAIWSHGVAMWRREHSKSRPLTRLDKARGRFHDHYKYKHMEETVGDETSIGRYSTLDRERGLRRSAGSAAPRPWTMPIQIPSWLNRSWSTSN